MEQIFLNTIWAFVIGLSIFRYFEEDICLASFTYGRKIVSFIIGAMIPIIFLELLNDTYEQIHATHDILALLLPFGFIASFLIERHIYSHPSRKNKKRELHKMYAIISSISAFFLGIIFATNVQATVYQEILLLVTFCLFHLMSSVYVHHIDTKETQMHSSRIRRIIYAFSPVYGFTLALTVQVPQIISVSLFAIFSGALMHVIVDDIMTEEKETILSWFLIGAILFTGLFAVDIFFL